MSARGSYRTRLREGISRYTPADAQALCDFRAAMYGQASVFGDVQYLRWMFERCPSAEQPALWLFRKDGQIFAQQGAIPVHLRVGGTEHRAAWALDLMVHPSYRLRGIGPVLVDVCSEAQPITMGLEVSAEAARALLREDWVDLGTLPLYVRPLSLGRLFKARVGGLAGSLLGRVADAPLAVVDQLLAGASRAAGLAMTEVTRFDEQVDALWSRVSASFPVIARRDARTLNWRFAEGSRHERYRLFTFTRRGEVRGYAVLRLGETHGLPSGHIVDFLSAPSTMAPLLAQCLTYLRAEGAAAAYCAASWGGCAATLRGLGFFRRDTGFRLMYRTSPEVARDTAALAERANWFITSGDANTDRPREGLVFA